MEKNYLYNLYKNIKKYDLKIDNNLKLNNNSYLINKINKLHGGVVANKEALDNIEELDALLNAPDATPVPIDPRDKLIEELSKEAENFLREFEEYKKKISSMGNINEDDITKLNKIKEIFDNIKTKIEQLV